MMYRGLSSRSYLRADRFGRGELDPTEYLRAQPQQHNGHNDNEHTADKPLAQVNCGAGTNPASRHIGASHGDSEGPVN